VCEVLGLIPSTAKRMEEKKKRRKEGKIEIKKSLKSLY
jgi:hypothetical protein